MSAFSRLCEAIALLRESDANKFGSAPERDASALASARFERAEAVARALSAAKRAARSAAGGGVADTASEVVSSLRGEAGADMATDQRKMCLEGQEIELLLLLF